MSVKRGGKDPDVDRMWAEFMAGAPLPPIGGPWPDPPRCRAFDGLPQDPEALARLLWREEWPAPLSELPLSTRLPRWLDEQIRAELADRREGPSVGLRRIVCEWWVREKFSRIEFRDGASGRRAAVVGGPEVWRIVVAWRAAGLEGLDDGSGVQSFLGDHGLDPEALDEVLDYSELFPEEIEAALREAVLPVPFARRPESRQR